MNALHPDRMTDDERLDEVARILAAGLLRHRSRAIREAEKCGARPAIQVDGAATPRTQGRSEPACAAVPVVWS